MMTRRAKSVSIVDHQTTCHRTYSNHYRLSPIWQLLHPRTCSSRSCKNYHISQTSKAGHQNVGRCSSQQPDHLLPTFRSCTRYFEYCRCSNILGVQVQLQASTADQDALSAHKFQCLGHLACSPLS